MPKMKFGVKSDVKTESGFGPYEGPMPKPGVAYPVELKQCMMKMSQAKNVYVKTLWEISDGECKGFGAWYNIVPGEHEIQQIKVAQFMQAICKKNEADIVHDDLDEGGKVKTIGGRNPIGTMAGMTFRRVKDTYNVPEGEEAPMVAETSDLMPGWTPKSRPQGAKAEGDEVDKTWETEPAADAETEEEEPVAHDFASKLTLAKLKALAEEWGVEEDDLPKSKSDILEFLVEEGIVAEPDEDEAEEDEGGVDPISYEAAVATGTTVAKLQELAEVYDLEYPANVKTKAKKIQFLVDSGAVLPKEEPPAEPEEEEEDEEVAAEEETESTEDEDDSEEEEADEETITPEQAAGMTLAALKALATTWEIEFDDSLKGPKGKKALVQILKDEEVIVDDEPPF